jgi:hypothetical protein
MIKIKEAACAGSIISRQRKLINLLLNVFEACNKVVKSSEACNYMDFAKGWDELKKQLIKCQEVINEQSD